MGYNVVAMAKNKYEGFFDINEILPPERKLKVLFYHNGMPVHEPLDPEDPGLGTGLFYTLEELRKILEIKSKYTNSKDFRKAWNGFIDITESESFRELISKLRSKYEVPLKGFNPKNYLEYGSPKPNAWKHNDDFNKFVEFNKDVNKICNKYHLYYFSWARIISEIIFYNAIEDAHFLEPFAPHLLYAERAKLDRMNNFTKNSLKEKDKAYPVVLRISPYAGRNDIIDYIKRYYSTLIKPLLDEYKDPTANLGRSKTKKSRTRLIADFLYKNQDIFPRKKLRESLKEYLKARGLKLMSNEDEDVAINKIIADERKRRRKVNPT